MNDLPLLTATKLSRSFFFNRGLFNSKQRIVKAVDDVTFALGRSETLALVGESGSGKSTTGRLALGMMKPTSGVVRYESQDLSKLHGTAWRRSRRNMQMIFQDSSSALDPRMTVGAQIEEVISVHGLADKKHSSRDLMMDALDRVGLGGADLRYPRELSGGQRQRIAIARALAMQAKLIVCDEPVSALDVSVQAQIVNLLVEMQEKFGLSYLFISHDLRVVRHISHRVAVMYLGRIVEMARTFEIFENPLHPYTRALLAAVPAIDSRNRHSSRTPLIEGELPDPASPPSGCRFQTRCPLVHDICRQVEPALADAGGDHTVACHMTGLSENGGSQ
ncbi:peptide ABC transporter ATP-binding protein [Mesorhizobium tianshanense]|uniref:Peptide/nickel transport system ATP-binding protein/oligopeptide transport system ATP-binding protein n=1 Tax=Mesorhizobium tianshanense TaxID=39844 RepID=A0A562NBK1_9HYPH|nr:ABC transporter ATP-binding protein [Mesorhizobium tianshanense]TWI29545.1 peptide/nickel transport system ATP-binding protein/oligopeptide transport system ATP-binding protein [Mesorhizobium tianshanense]GLS34934.1 peptide ABC transporter ATP-binding protein [Mesorhizobium tianshanense]